MTGLNRIAAGALAALLAAAGGASAQSYQIAPATGTTTPLLSTHVGGRVQTVDQDGGAAYRFQWPGVYFETRFHGPEVFFRTGPEDTRLRVSVDGEAVELTRPAPGLHRISGLSGGDHLLRIDVLGEYQAGPVSFGGVQGVPALTGPAKARDRQIEFIGDSHTVGYANLSTERGCPPERIWETTATADGVPGLVAGRYQADYQVNAISGRGVVRNYDGAPLDTVPDAYDYVLQNKQAPYADPAWRPQVIVVALGTNDFSTPVKSGEKWADQAALTADYEAGYARFLQRLASAHPRANIFVWGITGSDTAAAASRVVSRLTAEGSDRVRFVQAPPLGLNACDWHPDLADDRLVAAALEASIDQTPAVWTR